MRQPKGNMSFYRQDERLTSNSGNGSMKPKESRMIVERSMVIEMKNTYVRVKGIIKKDDTYLLIKRWVDDHIPEP